MTLSLRIPPSDSARCAKLADRIGVKPIDLHRIAIRALLDLADREGGTITLPFKLPVTPKPKP